LAVVGVDVGGTKIAAALVGDDGGILRAHRTPTPSDGDALLAEVARLVDLVSSGALAPPTAVGFGIASLFDHRGHALWSTHLDIADQSPGDELSAIVGLPVVVDNDANVAALAEARLGAARRHASCFMLTLGTGIGGGVVIDDHIFHGGRGFGGELGHVVVQADGPRCQGGCPNRGCVEALASGTALTREARGAADENPSGDLARVRTEAGDVTAEDVLRLARAGSAEAGAIVDRAGRFLGVALASLANVLSPDAIVIGGGMGSAAGELILAPAREEYRRRVLPPSAQVPIVPAQLGADAGVLGAALLAREAGA
jgi:glucokinase